MKTNAANVTKRTPRAKPVMSAPTLEQSAAALPALDERSPRMRRRLAVAPPPRELAPTSAPVDAEEKPSPDALRAALAAAYLEAYRAADKAEEHRKACAAALLSALPLGEHVDLRSEGMRVSVRQNGGPSSVDRESTLATIIGWSNAFDSAARLLAERGVPCPPPSLPRSVSVRATAPRAPCAVVTVIPASRGKRS